MSGSVDPCPQYFYLGHVYYIVQVVSQFCSPEAGSQAELDTNILIAAVYKGLGRADEEQAIDVREGGFLVSRRGVNLMATSYRFRLLLTAVTSGVTILSLMLLSVPALASDTSSVDAVEVSAPASCFEGQNEATYLQAISLSKVEPVGWVCDIQDPDVHDPLADQDDPTLSTYVPYTANSETLTGLSDKYCTISADLYKCIWRASR